MAVTLTNSFEGGSSGTGITPANSGGSSGNAFDTNSVGTGATDNYDNTHAAHGTLSCEIATGTTSTTSYNGWSTSLGTPPATIFFRAYLYITGTFAANTRVINLLNGTTSCGNVLFKGTTSALIFTNTSGTTILTSSALPTGQWVRVEGQFTGSATVGQWIYKIWYTADSTGTPDDTQTSAATLNTFNPITQIRFGIGAAIASAGPFWIDDVGYSDTAFLGPAVNTLQGAASLTGSGTLSVSSVVTELPSIALAAPGSLGAGAIVTELPSAAFTAPGTLGASAVVTELPSAAFTAPGTLGASAVVTRQAAAPLAAPGTLTAGALVTEVAAAPLSAPGQLTTAAGVAEQAAAALSAPGALAADATAGPPSEFSSVVLAASPALSATAHVRPEGLWAIYVAAAEAAAAEAQRWRMYRSLVGGSSQSGFAYGTAFEAENAADQAYQNWQAAYRAEFPGAAG